MLTQTGQFIGLDGYRNGHRARLLIASRGCRVAATDTHPQRVHTISTRACTVSPSCPHHVDAALAGPPLPWGPVRPTPLYDQMRGERINADVPPGDAPPHQLEDHAKHRLADGEPGSPTVGTRPLRTATHRANADISPRDADPRQRGQPAKDHLPHGEPDAAAAVIRPPAAAADRVASWSWFATAEPTDRPR